MTESEFQQQRPCGPCKVCCRVIGIRELEKPPGVQCKHVNPNMAHPKIGCTIYENRPGGCRDFLCLWAEGGPQNLITDDDRPDQLGIMLWSFRSQTGKPVVGIAEAKPDALGRPRVQRIVDEISHAGFEICFMFYDGKVTSVPGTEKWQEYVKGSDRGGGFITESGIYVASNQNGHGNE